MTEFGANAVIAEVRSLRGLFEAYENEPDARGRAEILAGSTVRELIPFSPWAGVEISLKDGSSNCRSSTTPMGVSQVEPWVSPFHPRLLPPFGATIR